MNSSGVVVQFLATCMVVEKHWDLKELQGTRTQKVKHHDCHENDKGDDDDG